MIDLDDGLGLDEVLQIAKWLKVAGKLKPELHDRLSTGTEALLAILTTLQRPELGWLLNFLPGGLSGQIAGGVDALRVMKELLDA